MIRAAIVIVILAAGAVLFLPQAVAAFPALEGVVGPLATEVAGARAGAVSWASDAASWATSWVSDALAGVLGYVGGAAADALPEAVGRGAG